MGNCCGGTERVDISSGKNGTTRATSHGPHHSQHAAASATNYGHNPPGSVHMTSSLPHHPASPTIATTATTQSAAAEYALQSPLRYPGDARGVYYQPTDTPTALLGMDFSGPDDKHQPPQSAAVAETAAAAAPAAAAETTTTRATTAETETTRAQSYRTTIVVNTATTTPHATVVPPAQPPPTPQSVADSVMPTGAQRQQSASYQPRDIMISYSRSDSAVMWEIKDGLEAQGISVWVDQNSIDAGADFLSKIGEAIIDAKFFICILSEKAVRSKYCRDEVALAYVSNTVIYPVNLQSREHLLPLMDTGLKLQLANYNWTSLSDADNRKDNLQTLISTMKAELDDLSDLRSDSFEDDPLTPPTPTDVSPTLATPFEGGEVVTSPGDVAVTMVGENGGSGSPVQSPTSDGAPPEFRPLKARLRERNRAKVMMQGDNVSHVMPEQFWSEQFGVVNSVTWDRFTGAFLEVFREPVKDTFTAEDQQQLLDILKRELEVESDNLIYKYQLTAFCSASGDALPLWPRVQEQARESFAMREVFNMDSSVRVEAIENLGKFRSAVVIDALRDLLTDPDANVRAVATVSLSRTNANDPVTIRHILRTLGDKDRLVREAGCLALGHLRARQAISKLSHLWRNDVISHVREAAAVALRQIGGQEVEDVMRVTRVLAEEIRSLTEAKA